MKKKNTNELKKELSSLKKRKKVEEIKKEIRQLKYEGSFLGRLEKRAKKVKKFFEPKGNEHKVMGMAMEY